MKETNLNDMAYGSARLPKPKFTTVSCAKVNIHPLNFRFDGTNNELSINTTGIGELEEQIRRDGRILKRIVINHNSTTGELGAVVGGRRLRCAKKIHADPQSPQELVKAMEQIDTEVYTDLTDDQILFLVNDQDQKAFCFSEVLDLEIRLFGMGKTWKQVAAMTYRQRAKLTGQADILNDVDAISDPDLKHARIAKWLRGTVDEVVGEAFRIGPMCLTQLRLAAAEKDKLIKTKANTPKDYKGELVKGPEVKLTDKRLDVLRKAKQADMKADQWNGLEGGPEFKKIWEKFRLEDLGLKEDGTAIEDTPKIKSMGREKILAIAKNAAKSRLAIKMCNLCAGDDNVTWNNDDMQAALFEAKLGDYLFYNTKLEKANPDLLKILKLVFNENDPQKFRNFLAEVTKDLPS